MKSLGVGVFAALLALQAAGQTTERDPDDTAEAAQPAADTPARRPAGKAFRPVLRWGVDDLRLETGVLPDAPQADGQTSLSASPYLLWQPDRAWEFRAGALLTATDQRGGAGGWTRRRGDLAETYLRYRNGDTRLTAGAQTIVWGRVDEIPTMDRVGRADLTRLLLDDLADRRRATPALRWEQGLGDVKLDAVVLPVFRAAELPDLRSVWSPIDRSRGRVLGLAPDPALAGLVRSATIVEEETNAGGAAVRLTRAGVPPLDFGLTLARTRQSVPYYRADPANLRLVEIHPYQTFLGVDGEFVAGGATWRAELGHTSDVPVTTIDGRLDRAKAWDWIGAAEFFPGGGDLRVNLQLAARRLRTDRDVLDRTSYFGVNGEVESPFAQGRWKWGLRFASGLNVHDLYVAPRLSYLGWEPHEFYVVGRYFEGDERSLGGFHRDHGMIAVGLRTRF